MVFTCRPIAPKLQRADSIRALKPRFSCSSQALQVKLESNLGMQFVRFTGQHYGTDKLRGLEQRIVGIVPLRIALEGGISGEVELRDQWLVPRRHHHVVDVLTDAAFIRIMARKHGLKTVRR